jgi:tetratricopeptide (TPR) repeat protein
MKVKVLLLVVLLLAPSFLLAEKIQVHFVDQDNKSLGNVESKLVNTQSHEEQTVKGNKKGEAEFTVSAGVYQLYAQAKGHLTAKSEPIQVADKDTEVTLILADMEAFKKVETAGNAAFSQGNYQEALEQYQRLLTMAPLNAVTWSNVARAQAGLKNREKAKEAAQKAAAEDPEQFKTLEKQVLSWVSFTEGRDLLEQKQFAKAVALLTESTEGDPSNPEAFYGLALAYGHQGKYDEALKCIDQALKLKPDEQGFLEVKQILEHNAQVTSKK